MAIEEDPMGTRSEALAKQFEAKAQEAVAVLEQLSDASWKHVTEAEHWTEGVTAHHLASALEPVARMMQFNEELVQVGALIALDGLHPRARGARVACSPAHRDRRALHRGARSDRRLLDDPGELEGSSGRMGQAVSRLGRQWH
jgi:hypothetical protein